MNDSDDVRLPPHHREAERSILGSMLRDNQIIPDMVQRIRADDFYVFAHQKVFLGLTEVAAEHAGKVDYLTLGEWIKRRDLLEDIGGFAYLVDLWDSAPGGVGNAIHYADIVRQKSIARHLIHACHELAALAFEPAIGSDELLEAASRRFCDVSSRGITSQTKTFDEVGIAFLEEMDRRQGHVDGEVLSSCLTTGWKDLDKLIAGFFKGELTIIAARPSQGKSLVAGRVAGYVAGCGHPVFFSCLEQRNVEIFARAVSALGPVPSNLMRSGSIPAHYREKMIDAASELRPLPIFMDDTPGQTTMRIGATARRHVTRDNLKMVIVDYLQLVEPESRREPRHEQVSGIARRLKLLARELDIPVIALAQVGRSAENRVDRRPQLADLKESGGIEEHADCVIMIHKPEAPDFARPVDQMELIVEKCRNGPTGSVFLAHDKRHFDVTQAARPGEYQE